MKHPVLTRTFTRTHAKFMNVPCPKCGSAIGVDCRSSHPKKTAPAYPVKPHHERRQQVTGVHVRRGGRRKSSERRVDEAP